MFISLCMLIFATVVTTTRTHEQLTSMSIKGEIFALIEPRHSYAGIVESNAVTTLPKKKKNEGCAKMFAQAIHCAGV